MVGDSVVYTEGRQNRKIDRVVLQPIRDGVLGERLGGSYEVGKGEEQSCESVVFPRRYLLWLLLSLPLPLLLLLLSQSQGPTEITTDSYSLFNSTQNQL